MVNEKIKNKVRGKYSFFIKVISVILVMAFIVSNLTVFTVFAAGPVLTINKSVDKTNPLVGENFVYTIKYANPSTTEDAYDVELTDILPSNLVYVSHILSDDVLSTSVTNDGTHDKVIFTFTHVLTAGHTGIIKIVAKFPEGKTPLLVGGNPNVAINTATIKPTNGDLITSNPVTVTPKLIITPDWSVEKTKYIPASVSPALDQNVTYEVKVNSNSAVGGLNLKNIVVTDTIPVGSTYVSSTDGGTYNAGKVTWNLASLDVGTSKKLYIVIKYPSAMFTKTTTVTNNVLATATQFDNSPAPDKSAQVSHSFTDPVYDTGTFVKNGRQSNDRYSVGQTAQFYLDSIKNLGNVPFDKFEVIDNIPNEVVLSQISTGSYSSSVSVQVQYKTNSNSTWRTWNGSPFASPTNTNLNVSSLVLSTNEYVTQVKWVITDTSSGQIQPGFTNTNPIRVSGPVSMPLVGNTITNTATIQAFAGTNPVVTKNASKDIYIIEPMPWLVPQKTIKDNQKQFNYNDTVEFTLKIKNNDLATGDYVDPIAVDTIPPEYENITYLGWDNGNTNITTPPIIDFSSTKLIGTSTYTLFKANVTGTLQPGQYVDIKYSAKIKNKTIAGYLTNSLYISTEINSTAYENPVSEIIVDSNDFDNDASLTDKFVKSDAKIFVNFMGSLESQLLIKGQNDADFGMHQYPDYTQTLPGGLVNYRLIVKNSGSNGPISNLVIINKLPTINDTGVIDSSPRDTKWNPYLVNLITGINGSALPAGTKVYYSTVVSPTGVELLNPLDKVGNSADLWSLTPPVDITTVKSVKFDFGSLVFNTNDQVVIEWPMRAPVGAPTNLIAWDSFGYGATYPDSDLNGDNVVQATFLPSEPLKVGFKIQDYIPFSAGNFVWEDMNRNGIQDAGEKGINGVLVNLYQKNGTNYDLVGYTRTGNDQSGNAGYYTFPDTSAGTYRVEFVYPKTYTDTNNYTSNYYLSPYLSGSDRTVDSNGNPATITDYTDMGIIKNSVLTSDVILTADDLSIDLGIYRLGQIGDTVWYDRNANGLFASETGLSGVTVSLLDSLGAQAKYGDNSIVAPVLTNATGKYLFSGLEPGVYKVKFDIPVGYKLSNANTGADDNIDSDPIKDAGATATTANITLKSGEVNLSVDMGVYLAHIGNLVFNDLNADGLKNGSDAGISGVTVNLYKDANPVVFKTTTTNGSGIYSFDDLFPGSYVVEAIKPATYNKYSPTTGTTPLTNDDSDVSRTTGKTDAIIINAGDRIDTMDAGLYKFGSIGNLVWNDYNANGIQDGGEPGISGINVNLTDKNGNPVTDGLGNLVVDLTTNVSGIYTFSNLEPGEYIVTFTNPGQIYKFSPTKQGSNNAVDSDGVWVVANDTTAKVSAIIVTSGSVITTVDQGMYLGSLGDFVWNDLNANGIQDSGEAGISGVSVSLLDGVTLLQAKDANGNLIAALTTNSSGGYRFDNLGAGTYVVQFTMPTGYDKITNRYIGAIDKDSNTDLVTLRSEVVTLLVAERNFTIDAGFFKYATIGDFIWEDKDADGIQDAGETGIAGATVNLIDSLGGVIATTTTNASGIYIFNNLIPGTYSISVVNPTGYDGTSPQLQGSNTVLDSNINVSTLKSNQITVISGENNTTMDAGFYKFASIGDYVWEDVNGNGIQEVGENPIANVTVKLLNNLGTEIASATTDASGFYTFTSLLPSTYTLAIVKPAAYGGITLKAQGSDTAKDSNISQTTLKSDPVTLISGENNMTIDAGLYKNASIGDFVWNDINANGIQDAGELGISGVRVNLLNSSGVQVLTMNTDTNGGYLFTGLIPASYFVEVIKPIGYVSSPKTAGSNTAIDSNINVATSRSDLVSVISGESNITIDAGLYKMASIGDFVWEDKNANGIQNVGEAGITGVTVRLLDGLGVFISSTTTDSTGKYSFTNLNPGNYIVEVIAPNGFVLTSKGAGTVAALDSDMNDVTIRSDVVTLASAENNTTIDAGFYKLASIGDFVWEDKNANGIQDSGENGISGATVKLLDSFGGVITTTTTDASGAYSFTDLVPGTYAISVVLPTGFDNVTTKTAGTNVTIDSDLNFANLTSDNVTIISGENNTTIDAGFYKYASIGDFVWNDINANGIQDAGETGIEGVRVNLFDSLGNLNSFTFTNSTGYYSFNYLDPGNYSIGFVKPAGYSQASPKTQGSNLAIDSNISVTTLKSDTVTLVSGENNNTLDAGFYKLASIGDFVWNDTNADGIQDTGELGIAGVTVYLVNQAGTRIDNTTTDLDGNYSFTNIVPGTYTVEIINPIGFVVAPKTQGSDTAKDSNIDVTTSKTDSFTLISGQNNITLDAGLYKKASIGDFVWEDKNANGKQDAGEAGIAGVTVNLFNNIGTQIDTTTTDLNGYYNFINLDPGTYTVSIIKPTGFDNLSDKAQGTDISKDSNLNVNLKSDTVTLISGEDNSTIDAGFYKLATIGDFVWNDKNADGIQDSGETGIVAVTVNLLNNLGVQIKTTTTDSSGNYSFISLIPGSYTVEVVKPIAYDNLTGKTKGSDTTKDSNLNTNLKSDVVTLASGENNTTIDAGFYMLASLGNYVWEDKNANGIQDIGENVIVGVTVKLLDSLDNILDTAFTDANGLYSFTGLIPGDYKVAVVKPTGFDKLTGKTQGTDTDIDSNFNTNFESDIVTLISGENNITIDAGFYKYASIGDFVWDDSNINGVQDLGEHGISGVTVNLLDINGTQISSTNTDSNGYYHFINLIPGIYSIKVVKPTNYFLVNKNQGSDIAKDSNLNPSLQSDNVTIISGENNNTLDAGFYKLASLGDFVWEDKNANGIQDVGETGIAGVTVNLLNSSGGQITSTTTDSLGYYKFDLLLPGTYQISVVKPSNYSKLTYRSQGSDTAKDSDIDAISMKSQQVTLISGENNNTLDAGFYNFASIGDFVWEDMNANGIQNVGEHGISLVKVNLLNSLGNLISSTTTDINGNYLFSSLIPGSYQIEIVKPISYNQVSDKLQGSNIQTDNNIDKTTFKSEVITVSSGENNLSIDAGLFKFATIGDYVWEDMNANGKQDAGEIGIALVTVNLLDENQNVVGTTVTNESGFYSFGALIPGDYSVAVVKPTGFDNLTGKTQGADTAKDSNLNPDLKSDAVTLLSGENNTTIDAGFYKLASIGDYVWEDMNANGIQDLNEPAIAGVTVNLFNSLGVNILTTTTDSNGFYHFTDLVPSTYTVAVTKPTGFDNLTGKTKGTDTAKDSNLNPDLKNDAVTLVSGENNSTIDAGFYKLASIGDYVWYDDNSNSINDEPLSRGVNGVTVYLYDENGTLVNTTITANDQNGKPGFYIFSNLVPSSYYVQFSTLPTGYSPVTKNVGTDKNIDSNADVVTLKTDMVVLSSGQYDNTLDMGIKFNSNPIKMIGKTDTDQSTNILSLNGDKEAFEYTIGFDVPENCVGVQITDNLEDVLMVNNFENDIKIHFNNIDVTSQFNISYDATSKLIAIIAKEPSQLVKGRYLLTIKVNIITGSDLTKYTNDTISNIATIKINNTETDTNIVKVKPLYASVGKYVWIDDNKDGIQNEGADHGINGIKVELFDKYGTLIATTITANDSNGKPGYYLITKINPGEYYVKFSCLPKDFIVTKDEVGDHYLDSDVNGATLSTDLFILKAGEQQLLWDMGIYYKNPKLQNPDTGDENGIIDFTALAIIFSALLISSRRRKRKLV